MTKYSRVTVIWALGWAIAGILWYDATLITGDIGLAAAAVFFWIPLGAVTLAGFWCLVLDAVNTFG